ncbi:hypothetical protein [Aeromicrobium sp. Root472D3]|uniref:hypothetical protein n=1 Tax=Aeromicrobium sp. Root472D3 TaxID=1736540 RepID=UPI0012FBA422|nr:hypothetical protein [Aeromicrobium sp. Root472D3]
MGFWTSANPPWWLSVLTLLIGLFGAHFATKYSDQRRFEVEDQRQASQRASEKEQYLVNRILDETGLLLAVAEEFRLYLWSGLALLPRGEDGKIASPGEGASPKDAVYLNVDDVLARFTAQIFRVEMVSDGDLQEAVVRLKKASQRYYISGVGTLDEFRKRHEKFKVAMSVVRKAAHKRVTAV